MRVLVYLLCLVSGTVSGFLVQNGGTATSNSQSNDQAIQNLYNLIVNEQTSRLQMQSEINELKTKLNEVSARLVQMEQSNADVSKQLTKEKNNREHLEEMYAAMEKRVLNLTTADRTNVKQSEIHIVESKINNFEVSTLSNLTDITTKLSNLTTKFERTKSEAIVTNQMLISNNTLLQDKLVAMETNINNVKTDSNTTQTRLGNMSTEISVIKKVLQNVTENGLSKSHESVGFSVSAPDTASGSPLKFTNLIYNTGNGYNMSSGMFTCQYPGLYFFTATMFRNPGIRESYCYIQVNGHRQLLVNSGTGLTTEYQSGSESLTYRLNAGDKVSLSRCSGVDHMNSYSSFTGFLISY